MHNRKLTMDQSTFTFTLQFGKVSLVQPGFNSPLEMGYFNPGFPRIACVFINVGLVQVSFRSVKGLSGLHQHWPFAKFSIYA